MFLAARTLLYLCTRGIYMMGARGLYDYPRPVKSRYRRAQSHPLCIYTLKRARARTAQTNFGFYVLGVASPHAVSNGKPSPAPFHSIAIRFAQFHPILALILYRTRYHYHHPAPHNAANAKMRTPIPENQRPEDARAHI